MFCLQLLLVLMLCITWFVMEMRRIWMTVESQISITQTGADLTSELTALRKVSVMSKYENIMDNSLHYD